MTSTETEPPQTLDYARRFGGIARVYGDDGLERLRKAHVCVIGIGGVGSWLAEAFARSAVGAITLIDMDVVSESNINRQLVATADQIGRDKITVMASRIEQINPECRVTLIDDFISRDNLNQLIDHSFSYVVDCIDDFRTKAALIAYCRRHAIKILTTGGAGGQIDPSKLKLADLSNTEHDVLLARTRKLLRQDYGFPKNLKRSFGVKTVYSQEQLSYPDGTGGLSPQKPKPGEAEGRLNGLNCAGGLGSITHVTAGFAMLAASHVLNTLALSQANEHANLFLPLKLFFQLPPLMNEIVLSTLNARYIHSSFGLRYLQANLHELQERSVIREFVIDVKPDDAVEAILALQPKIVGFGVYIWNAEQTERVVRLLRAIAPQVTIVLGGPEVSYELDGQAIVELADHVVTGWGEKSFYDLCKQLLSSDFSTDTASSPDKVIVGQQLALKDMQMPYDLYNEDDVANRLVYVEASRGCPYKCEFCLSALDKTAWPFDLERFLLEMDKLHTRGVRHFKFVDRTFNLKIKTSLQILDFFLERMSDDLFLHFEVIPDHLPDTLKEKIAEFPEGCLQFEIGIQTFNPQVQERISRKQKNAAAQDNLRWIRTQSNAYIHADLIYGLPGEDIRSFANSFNTLYALNPHEIQVGILKRLKGSPIVRHTQEYGLVFNPNPPFNIVQNKVCSFAEVQSMNRFARYWDLLANSGRFRDTLPILLEGSAFDQFMQISDAIFGRTRQTHKIALIKLYDLLLSIAVEDLHLDESQIKNSLESDYERSGLKSLPKFLRELGAKTDKSKSHKSRQRASRQARQLIG